MVIREYVKKIGENYLLSATEYYMPECYLMLEAVLENLKGLGGLVFYSTHLLPLKKENRNRVLNKLLLSDVEVHFALEEIQLKRVGDIKIIDDIFLVRELSPCHLDLKEVLK